jgi:hypothetical protein
MRSRARVLRKEPMSGDFDPEQKRYLEGFVAGLQIAARGGANAATNASGAQSEPSGPDADALRAQNRVLNAGGKLSDQEKFKRELNPLDGYERLKAQAAANEYPKPADNFRWRWFGLFYVAPNQNSYMSSTGSLPASPISPSATAAAMRTSPPAPTCRSARSRPRTPSRWRRPCRNWASARAAPAPTTSATSPARRPPASTRRS